MYILKHIIFSDIESVSLSDPLDNFSLADQNVNILSFKFLLFKYPN